MTICQNVGICLISMASSITTLTVTTNHQPTALLEHDNAHEFGVYRTGINRKSRASKRSLFQRADVLYNGEERRANPIASYTNTHSIFVAPAQTRRAETFLHSVVRPSVTPVRACYTYCGRQATHNKQATAWHRWSYISREERCSPSPTRSSYILPAGRMDELGKYCVRPSECLDDHRGETNYHLCDVDGAST